MKFSNCLCILALIFSNSAFAVGEGLLDRIMRSDFVFDRDQSNVPFVPIGWLTASKQNNLSIDEVDNVLETTVCGQNDNCDFDFQSLSQGFGLPVYVDKKNMIILGETLDSDLLEFDSSSTRVNTVGALAAWVSQPSEQWQLGAAIYAYKGFSNSDKVNVTEKSIAGIVGRYRHSPVVHSYYGLLRYDGLESADYFPYLGFDWFVNQQWTVSGLLPWPTVSYAPSKNSLYQLGLIESGNSFKFTSNNNQFDSSFSQWQLGISAERQVYKNIWASLSAGYTTPGGLIIKSGSSIEIDTSISSEPFLSLSLKIRP